MSRLGYPNRPYKMWNGKTEWEFNLEVKRDYLKSRFDRFRFWTIQQYITSIEFSCKRWWAGK